MCTCQRLLATNCYFNHRLLCNLTHTYLVTREMTYSNLHHGRPILKMSSGCCSTERYWRKIRFNLYQTIICLNIIVSIKSLLFIGLHCTCVHATDFMEKDKDSHFAQFTIWLVSLFPGVGIATEPWCGWPHLHKTARAHLFCCICDVRQAPNLLLLTSTHHR